ADPAPYAGGGVPSLEKCGQPQPATPACTGDQYAQFSLEHNSYHVTQSAADHSATTVTSATTGKTYNKADLQYITQENVTNCNSTSGGGAGRFVIANLAGSYGGKAWTDSSLVSTDPSKRYFLEKIGDFTPKDLPGSSNTASCSAHWFTVEGQNVAIAFYGQGVRVLDVSD